MLLTSWYVVSFRLLIAVWVSSGSEEVLLTAEGQCREVISYNLLQGAAATKWQHGLLARM